MEEAHFEQQGLGIAEHRFEALAVAWLRQGANLRAAAQAAF